MEQPSDREQPTIDHVANLADPLHNIHSYAHEHLKLASDQMKSRYDRWANHAGYHEGDSVALSPNPHKGEIAQALILMGGPE
jgi:hypothetical protein